METEMDDERWVNARLRALEPSPAWRPDATRAWERFTRRRRVMAIRLWSAAGLAAAAVAGLAIISATAPWACAQPLGCEQAPAATAQAKRLRPEQFKLNGSPTAPVTIEIYSDYQCPSCAYFFKTTMPQLDAQYVRTGKVKILHRDLPLPQHAYARLAARYANAAGEIGRYSAAGDSLFQSQVNWGADGKILSALAFILTPDEMKFVRHAVDSDPHLDDTVSADLTMALKDDIRQTPSLVIVSKSGRRTLTQTPSFEALQAYLDSLLSQ
jgi:protein-disulfide isomerase